MQFVAIFDSRSYSLVLSLFHFVSYHTPGDMGGAHVYAQLQTAAAVFCIL